MSAIDADFATYKPVPTRRVLQIVLEVPLERQGEVFAVLGYPMPGESLPVAVARLETADVLPAPSAEGASRPPNSIPAERGGKPRASDICNHTDIRNGVCAVCDADWGVHWGSDNSELGKPKRRPWHELTRAQQAGIRCGDGMFRGFLVELSGLPSVDSAEIVRHWCGVPSRAYLDTDAEARDRWDALDAEYRRWAGLETEPRG